MFVFFRTGRLTQPTRGDCARACRLDTFGSRLLLGAAFGLLSAAASSSSRIERRTCLERLEEVTIPRQKFPIRNVDEGPTEIQSA